VVRSGAGLRYAGGAGGGAAHVVRGVAARSLPGRSGVGRRARPALRSPWSVAPHPLTRAKIGQPVATAFLPAGVTANHTLPTPWPVVSPAALSPL